MHGGRSDGTQKVFLLEWQRDDKANMYAYNQRKWRGCKFEGILRHNQPFNLSRVACPKLLTPYFISRNSFMKFFGIGAPIMKTIEKKVNEGGIVPKYHSLTD